MVKEYLKLIRVKHYIKNFIMFFPLFFGGKILDIELVLNLIIGFIIFSLGTSIIYVINDIKDVEKDKNHPTKCKRPLASGAISIKQAKNTILLLIVLDIVLSAICLKSNLININAIVLLIIYIFLNIAYSRYLKKIPVLDIAILSSGFVIRLYYGSIISNIVVSELLYLTVLGASLYMAIGKRRNELSRSKETREVLAKYSYDFLDKNMYVALSFTEVCYTLWTLQMPYKYITWTVPITIFIAMKYSLIVESKESEGNPVDILLSDRFLQLLILFFIGVITMDIYFS